MQKRYKVPSPTLHPFCFMVYYFYSLFLLIKLQWLSLWGSCLIKLHKIDWLFFSYFMLLLFLSFLQNADCLSLFTSWYWLWFLIINTISKAAAHVIAWKMYTTNPVITTAFHFRQFAHRYPVSIPTGFYPGQWSLPFFAHFLHWH